MRWFADEYVLQTHYILLQDREGLLSSSNQRALIISWLRSSRLANAVPNFSVACSSKFSLSSSAAKFELYLLNIKKVHKLRHHRLLANQTDISPCHTGFHFDDIFFDTPSSFATISTSFSLNQPKRCLVLRRLKNNLRCAFVVATFTIRQLRRTYSWISALIQCTAKIQGERPLLD